MRDTHGAASDMIGGILAAVTIFFVGGGILLFVLDHAAEVGIIFVMLSILAVFAYQKFAPKS
jgi:hypothetical protein